MKYIGAGAVPNVVSATEFRRAIPSAEICPDDDALIEMYLNAAQEVVSYASGRPLAPGEYEFTVQGYWRRWWFPCAPVSAITGLDVMGVDGDWQEQPLDDIQLVNGAMEPQLVLPVGWGGFHDSTGEIRVQAVVGHETPPLALKQAIILLAKEWLEAGLAVGEVELPKLAFGITSLIRQRRYMRPRECA
ncbi:head-tail connector protein [Pontibaca salina]|uniref:Phage gp6-like head-tail connector protein n=1 Tax=Pontibaca salina TaxID=2795731 RepID=A0A934LYV4_9RHOB|nr:head-tail connector protein [Pontibaca salina]MBI6628330.1 phage gp6-like head-tail connector protein [Pontibaca salina]